MKSLISYFDCGQYYPHSNPDAGDFVVEKYPDLIGKIVPFFVKYPIVGVKALDFADFSKVAQIMKQGRHLTEEGIEEIRLIKNGMNRGRD